MHILYSLAVVQAHTVIIRSVTPCRWMLVRLDSYHATIWQTSGRGLFWEHCFAFSSHKPDSGRSQSDFNTLSLVYLCSFAAPALQVKCLYELLNDNTFNYQLCKCSVLRLYHRDVDYIQMQVSSFAVFSICVLLSVHELLLATAVPAKLCHTEKNWDFLGLLHCNVGTERT